MLRSIRQIVQDIFTVRFNLTSDLLVLAISWLLVVGSLYTATFIVGSQVGGGLPYFALYAVVGATLFGIGIPLYWMVVVRRRPLADLGLTFRAWRTSLVLQIIFAALQFAGTLANVQLPPWDQLLPLVTLALAIGFFEAVFWRGWVLLRLEEAFGIIPAILLGSLLYAAYHIGYGMPLGETTFLFFIGVMFAVAFRLTRSVLILFPLFQPMGQLVTLVRDGLSLPVAASLGFIDVLALMFALVWLAARRYKRQHERGTIPAQPAPAHT